MLDRVPDQTLIKDAMGANDRIQATRGKDYIFVYSYAGKTHYSKPGKNFRQRSFCLLVQSKEWRNER